MGANLAEERQSHKQSCIFPKLPVRCLFDEGRWDWEAKCSQEMSIGVIPQSLQKTSCL